MTKKYGPFASRQKSQQKNEKATFHPHEFSLKGEKAAFICKLS
ncbi:hypothetical protein [Paenibacillus polymyxa]|nr:hypothetical protein [Paenibacillus polymyxa]